MKLTAKEREAIRSRPWNERVGVIHARWPSTPTSTGGGDAGRAWWYNALTDDQILGRLYGDILTLGWGTPTRRGQRTPLEDDNAVARHFAIEAVRAGLATVDPFHQAFSELASGRSTRNLARRVGIERTRLLRLLAGSVQPTPEEMAQIADTFDKPATYFLEYRVYLAVDTLAARLLASPEQSIELVHRLRTTG